MIIFCYIASDAGDFVIQWCAKKMTIF